MRRFRCRRCGLYDAMCITLGCPDRDDADENGDVHVRLVDGVCREDCPHPSHSAAAPTGGEGP